MPSANPSSGAAPLTVAFSGSASTDPEGGALTYAWDFDGNGTDDATTATASHTYTTAGTYQARLRVTDPGGLRQQDRHDHGRQHGARPYHLPPRASPIPWAT